MAPPRPQSRSQSFSQSGSHSRSPKASTSGIDHRANALRAASGLSLEAVPSVDSRLSMTRAKPSPSALPLPINRTKARSLAPSTDEPSPQFSDDVVDHFLIHLHEGVSHQGFLPYEKYITPFANYPGLDLASYFWLLAGPSARGHNICWSWRYLAGCILRLDDGGWHGNSGVRFTKQDRSEWRKVTKFVNRIITRIAPKLGTLAFVMLDTMATNASICHQLRKMARRHAEFQAELIAMKIDAMKLPHIELTTHSMQTLRILETLTGESRETISAKIGLPEIRGIQRSLPIASSNISPADIQRQNWQNSDMHIPPLPPTVCSNHHDHCTIEQLHDSPMWTGDGEPSPCHPVLVQPSFSWVSNSFEWQEWTHVDDCNESADENDSNS